MAISRERDTATHQPRDTKARRRRRILGRLAEPPALSVCGACAGRRRRTDAPLPGSQGGAAQRRARRGSRERGARAACPPSVAGAGPPSRTQSGCSLQTLVRRREPRSDVDQGEEAEGPQPLGRPEAGPAHSRPGPGLPFPAPVPPHTLPGPRVGCRAS